jgi:sec-independent protein translocase protein TatB
MLDLSWGEIMVIGAVAVIFIGPKELPGALRAAGKWIGKARMMAREFQNNVDDMIREAELDEVKKQVTKATDFATGGISGAIKNAVDPKGELDKALQAPDLGNLGASSSTTPATPPASAVVTSEPAPALPAPAIETPAQPAVTPVPAARDIPAASPAKQG